MKSDAVELMSLERRTMVICDRICEAANKLKHAKDRRGARETLVHARSLLTNLLASIDEQLVP